jgi:DNA replication protein DnaC
MTNFEWSDQNDKIKEIKESYIKIMENRTDIKSTIWKEKIRLTSILNSFKDMIKEKGIDVLKEYSLAAETSELSYEDNIIWALENPYLYAKKFSSLGGLSNYEMESKLFRRLANLLDKQLDKLNNSYPNFEKEILEANIPKIMLNCSLDNYKIKEQDTLKIEDINWLKSLPYNYNKFIYFYGPCGTGKSHLAISLLKRRLVQYLPAKYYNANTVALSMKETNSEKTYLEKMNKFKEPELILIDDFCSDTYSEHVKSCFSYIINTRYDNLLPTIITSNLTDMEIEDKLKDARIVSRICSGKRLPILGDDYRDKVNN